MNHAATSTEGRVGIHPGLPHENNNGGIVLLWRSKMKTQSEKVVAFLNEIIEVCKRHKLLIGHEDGFGAFEIVNYDDSSPEWLLAATDKTGK